MVSHPTPLTCWALWQRSWLNPPLQLWRRRNLPGRCCPPANRKDTRNECCLSARWRPTAKILIPQITLEIGSIHLVLTPYHSKKGLIRELLISQLFRCLSGTKTSLLGSDLSHYAPHCNDGPFGCSTGHKGLSNSLRNQEGTLEETQRER